MSNNLVIKNDSFIQSMHNNVQCIESLDPNDKGTSRQYWFTASMLANIFDISKDTVRRRIESLAEWGEIQVTQNCATWKMTYENSNLTQDVTLYDLHAFNKLAMDLRTPAAREIKSKFSDILVEIETTGQYNVQPVVPQTYLEALKALVASEEEKEQLKLTNETLTTELTEVSKQRDKAIQTKQQISDSKTAKALGRVGGLVTANNRLKDELYLNRNYRTIGAIAQLNGISENSLNWRLLKSYCNKHDLEVMKIQGVRFQINVYPIEAFRAIYPELRVD